jgi:hypothetical protein
MELSTGQMALVFAGCALVIGGLFVAWRRGLFGAAPAASAPADAGAAHTGEAAK